MNNPNNNTAAIDDPETDFGIITLEVKQLCEWLLNGPFEYVTDCGHAGEYFDDGPLELGYRFCPYCGKTLTIPPSHQPHP